MNITDIELSIQHLESSGTSYENCEKLASLYIIRDHYKEENTNIVTKEISDILPQYQKYLEIKKRYQLGEIEKPLVEKSIKFVCKEIFEFIKTMYNCTDMEEERSSIKEMIGRMNTIFER